MKIASLQLQLAIPADTTACQWRPWILDHLKSHGEPLRWAITAVQAMPDGTRRLQLEAVVLDQPPGQ